MTFDGGGLFLLINPKGSCWWRLKYRFKGREKLISLGVYPQIGLASARRRRDEAKAPPADGVDPGEHRKAAKEEERQVEEGTFGHVAEDWLSFMSRGWSDESRRKAEYITRTHLVPKLGQLSVATLQTRDVVPVLREELLDKSNLSSSVWADSACRSKANERHLEKNGFASRIHRKKPGGRPMPERTARANARKSAVRARVEHVFAHQKDRMGLFVRTIGLARAEAKIGMVNLVCNMKRLIWLNSRKAAPA